MKHRIFSTVAIHVILVSTLCAQQSDWLLQIPKYFRLKGGSSLLVPDKHRGGVLFDGGSYDTYFTNDTARTWQRVFDFRMFYLDVKTKWRADDVGRWYFNGNVYGEKTINLVTTDAGESFRYTVTDTNFVPFVDMWQVAGKVYKPSTLLFNLETRASDNDKRGLYSTCDAGETWDFVRSLGSVINSSHMNPNGANSASFLLSDYRYALYDFCKRKIDSTNVDGRRGDICVLNENNTVIIYR